MRGTPVVDVRLVLALAAAGADSAAGYNMVAAHAAVAELIEADKEYDAAKLSGNALRIANAAGRRRTALIRAGGYL